MTLLDRLNDDLKDAMRARDEHKLSALRLVRAGIKNAEVAKGGPLDEAGVLQIIAKEVKERKDSLVEFQKASRNDLIESAELEIGILMVYMPEQLSREEVEAAAKAVIQQVGAAGPSDKGKVMSVLMGQLRGKADGSEINAAVTELLAAL